MVRKVQDCKFRPGIGIESVSFTGKRPRRPETGIKSGFEEMDHEFPIGIFYPEKQDYLFRCYVAPGNFPLGENPNVVLHLLSNRIFRKIFANGKQPFASLPLTGFGIFSVLQELPFRSQKRKGIFAYRFAAFSCALLGNCLRILALFTDIYMNASTFRFFTIFVRNTLST